MPGYLIDANLPRWFKPWSTPGYTFADDFGPAWTDTDIWRHASENALTIVTKDADFIHRAMAAPAGPRIIHFRTGNLTMRQFHAIVAPIWDHVCGLSAVSRIVQIYRDRVETIDPER